VTAATIATAAARAAAASRGVGCAGRTLALRIISNTIAGAVRAATSAAAACTGPHRGIAAVGAGPTKVLHHGVFNAGVALCRSCTAAATFANITSGVTAVISSSVFGMAAVATVTTFAATAAPGAVRATPTRAVFAASPAGTMTTTASPAGTMPTPAVATATARLGIDAYGD
jgi:hypothetical protein